MGSLFNLLETGVVLVTMFTVLVAAHELGHYLFARLFNMGVEEFAIGFGKRPILQWMRRTYEIPVRPGEVAEIDHSGPTKFDIEGNSKRPSEDIVVVDTPSGQVLRETTRFTIRPWPLGGFVRIKGMLPEEDGSETKIAGGFYSKAPWQRLMVLFAGPMFSVLAGILILVPLYMICGTMTADNRPIIGVVSDGPAAKAGLKEHDVVKTIDGKPISTFYDVNVIVRKSAGIPLKFGVMRGNQLLTLTVTPVLDDNPTTVFGPGLEPTEETAKQAKLWTHFVTKRVNVGFAQALSMAVSRPKEAVVGLAKMVEHPSTMKDEVGGPVAISTATYETVKQGMSQVLELAALLSISVGILNLLPVAPLDGGQMTMAFAEMFRRGKRLSMQVQSFVNFCGLIFMGLLIVCVFWIDISRLVNSNSKPKNGTPVKSK